MPAMFAIPCICSSWDSVLVEEIVKDVFFVLIISYYFCSLDFEECAHKLLKMQIKDEQLVSYCTIHGQLVMVTGLSGVQFGL